MLEMKRMERKADKAGCWLVQGQGQAEGGKAKGKPRGASRGVAQGVGGAAWRRLRDPSPPNGGDSAAAPRTPTTPSATPVLAGPSSLRAARKQGKRITMQRGGGSRGGSRRLGGGPGKNAPPCRATTRSRREIAKSLSAAPRRSPCFAALLHARFSESACPAQGAGRVQSLQSHAARA